MFISALSIFVVTYCVVGLHMPTLYTVWVFMIAWLLIFLFLRPAY